MRFIATCKIGLESVVSLELRRLGIEVEKVEDARVLFLGDYQTMAKACLWLRTAERVLMEVASFEARSFEELFQGVKAVSWRDYLKKDSFIHVNGKSADYVSAIRASFLVFAYVKVNLFLSLYKLFQDSALLSCWLFHKLDGIPP